MGKLAGDTIVTDFSPGQGIGLDWTITTSQNPCSRDNALPLENWQ